MELVKTLMLALYVLTYGSAAPCNKEDTAAKVILVKANGEKEVVRNEDVEDLLKSISLADQEKKRDASMAKKDLADVSANRVSHYIIIPDAKDSSSMNKRDKKIADIKAALDADNGPDAVHLNLPRQSNTSPEQGIWAWRGKKDNMVRGTHGKRSWNYFSKKMRNFMKKHGKGGKHGEVGDSKDDAYRYVIAHAQKDVDQYVNDLDE